ncbi:hypothetical protein [Xanthomonas citri]|uniref:hypothetical protein n=1 Tax=Xanthomonas citri TaxID=346 RepID=UPI00103CF1AD|nr:hypothetical protein [Xanthomonas citri]
MARIRTVKPEFFTSEDICALSPLARLLYIALWCEADKEGRFGWKPRTFKLRYFPADNCDIDALARELVASGLVILYGESLAYIPQFKKHQHINPRESASTLASPDEADQSPRVDDASARVTDAQGGREGKGKEGEKNPPLPPEGESADGEGEKPKPKRASKIGLDAFLQACRESGQSAVPSEDPVFAYADRIGLPRPFVALAWRWFKGRYADKRQAGVTGWRKTFRNAVEGNWPKFWFVDDAGQWHLTTTGKQAQMAADAEQLEAAA